MKSNKEAVIITVQLCEVNRREIIGVVFHGSQGRLEVPVANLSTGESLDTLNELSTAGVTQEFYKLTPNNPTTLRIPYMSKTVTNTVSETLQERGYSYQSTAGRTRVELIDLLKEEK